MQQSGQLQRFPIPDQTEPVMVAYRSQLPGEKDKAQCLPCYWLKSLNIQ